MNKGFCESLLKVINKSYGNAKIFYVCKGKFENKYLKDKKICKKTEIFAIIQENVELLRIAYVF